MAVWGPSPRFATAVMALSTIGTVMGSIDAGKEFHINLYHEDKGLEHVKGSKGKHSSIGVVRSAGGNSFSVPPRSQDIRNRLNILEDLNKMGRTANSGEKNDDLGDLLDHLPAETDADYPDEDYYDQQRKTALPKKKGVIDNHVYSSCNTAGKGEASRTKREDADDQEYDRLLRELLGDVIGDQEVRGGERRSPSLEENKLSSPSQKRSTGAIPWEVGSPQVHDSPVANRGTLSRKSKDTLKKAAQGKTTMDKSVASGNSKVTAIIAPQGSLPGVNGGSIESKREMRPDAVRKVEDHNELKKAADECKGGSCTKVNYGDLKLHMKKNSMQEKRKMKCEVISTNQSGAMKRGTGTNGGGKKGESKIKEELVGGKLPKEIITEKEDWDAKVVVKKDVSKFVNVSVSSKKLGNMKGTVVKRGVGSCSLKGNSTDSLMKMMSQDYDYGAETARRLMLEGKGRMPDGLRVTTNRWGDQDVMAGGSARTPLKKVLKRSTMEDGSPYEESYGPSQRLKPNKDLDFWSWRDAHKVTNDEERVEDVGRNSFQKRIGGGAEPQSYAEASSGNTQRDSWGKDSRKKNEMKDGGREDLSKTTVGEEMQSMSYLETPVWDTRRHPSGKDLNKEDDAIEGRSAGGERVRPQFYDNTAVGGTQTKSEVRDWEKEAGQRKIVQKSPTEDERQPLSFEDVTIGDAQAQSFLRSSKEETEIEGGRNVLLKTMDGYAVKPKPHEETQYGGTREQSLNWRKDGAEEDSGGKVLLKRIVEEEEESTSLEDSTDDVTQRRPLGKTLKKEVEVSTLASKTLGLEVEETITVEASPTTENLGSESSTADEVAASPSWVASDVPPTSPFPEPPSPPESGSDQRISGLPPPKPSTPHRSNAAQLDTPEKLGEVRTKGTCTSPEPPPRHCTTNASFCLPENGPAVRPYDMLGSTEEDSSEYKDTLSGKLGESIVDTILGKVHKSSKLRHQLMVCSKVNPNQTELSRHALMTAMAGCKQMDEEAKRLRAETLKNIELLLEKLPLPSSTKCLKPPPELMDYLKWLMTYSPREEEANALGIDTDAVAKFGSWSEPDEHYLFNGGLLWEQKAGSGDQEDWLADQYYENMPAKGNAANEKDYPEYMF